MWKRGRGHLKFDTFFDESGSPFECPLINGRDGVKCGGDVRKNGGRVKV